MKKAVIKIMIFLLLLAIGILICDWGYLRTDPYNTDKFKNMPEQIEICNVGASHSLYGFDYSDYSDYTTFNFGLDSQSHQYDLIILEHYKEKIKKGAVVFIVVSYPMIAGRDEIESEDFQAMNRRYYTFLPAKEIREYDFKIDLEMQLVPFANCGTIRGLIGGFFAGKDSGFRSRQTNAEEAATDAVKAAERHVGAKKLDAEGQVLLNQNALDAIREMIALCREIGAIPVLITTPFTEEYRAEIKKAAPDYYEHGFLDCIHSLQADTGVAYFDYSRDERFDHAYSLFMNSDHLNSEGARRFTDIIMKEVVADLNGNQ